MKQVIFLFFLIAVATSLFAQKSEYAGKSLGG